MLLDGSPTWSRRGAAAIAAFPEPVEALKLEARRRLAVVEAADKRAE
jgi:hypothetical protein